MDTQEAQELFKQYLYRRYGDRSTPKHYLSDLRIFLKQVGEKPLKEVNLRDIDGFVDQQRTEQMAATTINRRLATLHAFFECLAVQDLDQLWPNPVNWRRHRVKESDLLPREALEQEVEQLFSVIESALFLSIQFHHPGTTPSMPGDRARVGDGFSRCGIHLLSHGTPAQAPPRASRTHGS
jgi:site-specific recombinase XerD